MVPLSGHRTAISYSIMVTEVPGTYGCPVVVGQSRAPGYQVPHQPSRILMSCEDA